MCNRIRSERINSFKNISYMFFVWRFELYRYSFPQTREIFPFILEQTGQWKHAFFFYKCIFPVRFFVSLPRKKIERSDYFLKIRQNPSKQTRILPGGNRFLHFFTLRDQMSVIKYFTVRIFLLRGRGGCLTARHQMKYQIHCLSTRQITLEKLKDNDLIFLY